ncbi:MAG TPA: adenosylcobinamide-GDP ribazoletransferase [Candidatus Competibacteraceae bacterium]|nr:adenosylcobinamide-GDP ribazoletransferase [Candidatus Competibacteraceae bacterium]
MRPALLALQFLTRLPAPAGAPPTAQELGRSVAAFPLVGLVIGALLALPAWLLPEADPLLLAALLVTLWTLLTGGLHLDGLADCADAWVGGFGDRERTLAIMKDPRCGPIGVIAIVLLLLIKYAALQHVLRLSAWPLLWAPLLGRSAMVALLLTTPYVRAQGLGSAYSAHLSRRACQAWLLALPLLALSLGPWAVGSWLAAAAALLWLRRALLRRLGGCTGDTLGAACELVEAVTLLGTALLLR